MQHGYIKGVRRRRSFGWVTQPERLKGAKDEVRRPKG